MCDFEVLGGAHVLLALPVLHVTVVLIFSNSLFTQPALTKKHWMLCNLQMYANPIKYTLI